VSKGAGGTLLDYFLVDLDPSFALDTEEHLLYPLRSRQPTEPPLRQYCHAFSSPLSPCFCPPRRGLRPVKTWCSRRACASKHSQTQLRYGSLQNSFAAAGKQLGLNAVAFAERMQNGGIAELLEILEAVVEQHAHMRSMLRGQSQLSENDIDELMAEEANARAVIAKARGVI
jgi:hypothetical protein